MTKEEREAFLRLAGSLETAADLADILSRTLLSVLDGGARVSLPPDEAAELQELIGSAGAQAADYRALVVLARESIDG